MKKLISAVLAASLAASVLTTGAWAAGQAEVDTNPNYVEGEAIVCVNGGADALYRANRSRSAGFEVETLMEIPSEPQGKARSASNQAEQSLVLVKSQQDTQDLIEELENNPMVAYAEPNYYVEPYNSPTDPYYDYQWALDNKMDNGVDTGKQTVDANLNQAWNQVESTTTDTPVVAVLDSGVDYNHPDLQGVMWDDGLNYPVLTQMGGGKYGYNPSAGGVMEQTDDPMDTLVGHGTHCAGIIASQWDNNKGVAGVSSDVEIMAVKFLAGEQDTISGALEGYAYIQAAKQAGVNVVAINNSWGTTEYNGTQLHSITTAIDAVGKLGVLSCFAAGNSSTNNDLNVGSNPNYNPYLVTVGALESQGHAAYFSCYGETTVDVFAPGTQILAPTSSDTSILPYDQHDMPPQYLPQLMEESESYFYEDFEDGDTSVTLQLIDGEGNVVETATQQELTPGYTSSKGLQLPLTGIEERENFAIQMNFQKSDLANIDLNQPVYFALQGGIDNAMYGKTLVVQYYNEDGNWEELPSTTYSEEGPLSARLRFADYNWNQSSSELAETSFLQAEGDTVSLRFVPKNGTLENKTGDAVFRLDDVGFGKSAIPYYYADGTSMACPMVTGIAALLASKADESGARLYDVNEVSARIKGGVNREEAIGLEDKSVSQGFIDAAACFDDQKLVPVLNDIQVDGSTATLTGYFFGEQGNLTVGGKEATVQEWNDNSITFTLPEDVSGKQEIMVTSKDGDYGRDFFNISVPTKGFTSLNAPNLDYGSFMGYGLTSADGLPFAMAAAGDKIVSFGYMADTNDFYLEMYDIPTNQWEKVALPEEILYLGWSEFSSMAAGTDEIYLRYISSEGSNMLGTYHLDTNNWTTTPTQLSGSEALVVYQNRLIAVGGEVVMDNGDGTFDCNPLASVAVINPYTGEIVEMLPDMPAARAGAKAYVSGDQLVVTGGYFGLWGVLLGDEMETYHNTMVYDGTTWTEYEDDFLSDNNSQFDPMQTLDYAIGATDTGLIVTGPVSGLGQDSMMDTWRFDASNGNWSGDTNLLYHQGKTVRNIGVSYQDKFYVLSYNGEQLIFRCADIQCTGPTANPTEIDPPYLDTPANLADNWIYDAAQYMYEHGLMTGMTDTIFEPATTMSRAHFATVLYRLEGEPEAEFNPIFPDVPAGDFYSNAVMWGNKNNIITGYNEGIFDPAGMVTREQMVTMMYRYAQYKGYDVSKKASLDDYVDGRDVSGFAKDAMEWALAVGIIKGENNQGTINPQGEVSRVVGATVFMRFMERYQL
ncbi:S8 family serine peptidase [Massilioclostridium coli]|uniref:S8 family serine peptidase n=1 Tax=Massilioclostridium coli TaxID=1870991 RepID=UPI00085C97E1|nr:S8 family serine peptidase [Massilioclostridium coli]